MKSAGSGCILWLLLLMAAETDSLSEPSLGPGRSLTPRQSRCEDASNEAPEDRTGVVCAPFWDGSLCWEETPAGKSVTKACPDQPGLDLDSAENMTKDCDSLGNWIQSGPTCQPASRQTFQVDEPAEPLTEETRLRAEKSPVLELLLENEEECSEKMRRDPPYSRSGPYCGRNWDGWLCWDDTPAGTYTTQNCPEFFSDFEQPGKATKFCGEDGQWFQHPETNRIWTNYSLCASTQEKRLQKLKLLEDEYKCLLKMNRDAPGNQSGSYCSRTWDGWLCWDDTQAGTTASQICPEYFSTSGPAEKATKYCGEDSQWFRHPETNRMWTNYSLCSVTDQEMLKAAAQFSGDLEVDSVDEATVSPMVNPEEQEMVRKKILDSQYKCFEKMNRHPAYNKTGPYCRRNWDGWLCWDDAPAGTYASQNCPNYFVDFDPTEKATKYCGEDGQWFRHPDTNRTWSNYTLCNENTKAKLKSAYILFYMAIVGHALSIASLLISLAIFFYFRSLSCQRITLHKNLFCSYVLNSALTIIYLVAVVNNPEVVSRNPVGCKVLHFFHMYMLGCNYFWMLCEGIYLHTLIVVAVFAEEQHLHWYYLLGWGFPLVPASIHAVARKKYFDDNCWMSVETHLLYAVHGPIVAALLVNLFFLLNIIRVLVTKLRDTHRAESNMYMKAVRATLILVPLLGIQFVIFPWRPENRIAGEVYEYIMHILMHYQGLLVATIFCFFNGEVQAALKRQWMQYKTQWGQRRKEHCSMRSTSYTATSITEVPAFMYHHECNSEHLNGRHSEDSELVALKTGETYA
uniref:Calcitonin gene-related peptide type 1 receptor n=1 Tax=Tetraodon nigroviridis TaxID=99883 RepID=A7Z0B9_TETNG|nr:TPA: calcitonin receptor [Tetraodon nigroviridis]